MIACGVLAAPRPPSLAAATTGDADLARTLAVEAPAESGARDTLAAAAIGRDGVTFAGLGADDGTEFEIGSITKTFTALLLAQAAERGEVALDDPVGDHLDLGHSAAAAVTLADLSSHRSGLPRVATTVPTLATGLWSTYRGSDPYPYGLEALKEHARASTLSAAGTFTYSNLGVALLGQSLAAAAGTDYPTLLQTRILDPLGMADTSIAVTADHLPAGARTGYTATGRPAAAWTMSAYAPAGAISNRAVIVLGSTATSVDALALSILKETE